MHVQEVEVKHLVETNNKILEQDWLSPAQFEC